MQTEPNVAVAVIAAFGGLTKTAKALGHKNVSTVDGWKRAGRIPSWRRAEIIAGAEAAQVTLPAAFLDTPPSAVAV